MADFKTRLKELRLLNGFTQQELAARLGLHGMSVSGYERGVRKPSFEVLDNLAEIFDVSLDYLLGHTDDNKGYPARQHDRLQAYADQLVIAYTQASPDTQAAVRAILHLEEAKDGQS